jgi:uncharacterized membrane protein
MNASTVITINRPPAEVYGRWRDFAALPTFMYHLASVDVRDHRRSHWVAKAPAGRTVEWDAEITEDVPAERIAWRSVGESRVDNRGSVTFTPAPAGQGTELRVEIEVDLPGGPLGKLVAKLFGEDPHQQIKDDVRRFKQIVETGEVVRSDASPAGTKVTNQVSQRAAQPSTRDPSNSSPGTSSPSNSGTVTR